MNQLLSQAPPFVLVVEDDEDLRDELVIELSKYGHHVVGLEDGLELYDYLQAAFSGNGRVRWPDVIVSDVSLPGIDGITICERLFVQGDTTPFIFLTPRNNPRAYEAAARVGAAYVFDKPVRIEEVRDAVTFLSGI